MRFRDDAEDDGGHDDDDFHDDDLHDTMAMLIMMIYDVDEGDCSEDLW